MFSTLLWLTAFGETNYLAFSILSLMLLATFFWRVLHQKKTTKVAPSTPYWSVEKDSAWSSLPDQEIVTIAEYKAQKHRLLRS
ncbi:hypothetical protein [Hymenobacter volaticus]|uniref:Uncharacterized protein n=1 Tax=Hymenobacter volaticus TaxID=2932254 RepID=A0ABY4GG41_9BACT|nr:hypothetical protein [Hymenobacter volaticus]UOQ69773.1 hypothetical protein MUN86_29615 [Hymenobacter volaticus]